MNRQRVLAGPEPGEIDERREIVGGDTAERLAVAAHREIDRRRHRLGLQARAEIAQVHRLDCAACARAAPEESGR